MNNKELMFTEAELFSTGSDIQLRFYYKLWGEKDQHFVDDPDPKWLLDFVSKDKPYEMHDGHPWHKAFECAIAKEASDILTSELRKNGVLTDDEISAIIEKTISKYDQRLSKSLLIDSEKYLKYIDFPGQKVWQYAERW